MFMPVPPHGPIMNLHSPDERQHVILDRLAARGRVLAADLAREFGTSEDTIRRDMRELAAAGLCRRVYGGALPLSPASRTIREREREAPARKAALGAAAAGLVAAGQTVLIDAGSTNAAIARALPPGLGLTVVTNAPAIAAELAGRPGTEVVLLGGRLDPDAGACLGARAVRDVALMRPDLCFLGACAVDSGAGVAAFGFEEAEFKRAAVAASAAVAVAVTNEKLGTAAPHVVAAAAEVAHLVAEADADPARLAGFDRAVTRIHLAAAVGGPGDLP